MSRMFMITKTKRDAFEFVIHALISIASALVTICTIGFVTTNWTALWCFRERED